MSGAREPSMEDILASIKRVIAEEKEIRAAAPTPLPSATFEADAQARDELPEDHGLEDDVLELDEPVTDEAEPAPLDLGPPLVEERLAESSRSQLQNLASVAAAAPPPAPAVNPLEDMLREMLRPMLKQWLDDNLPKIVDEHVRREIYRITGR